MYYDRYASINEKEGSGKFVALGATGSSRLEGAASDGALREANRKGNDTSSSEPDGSDGGGGGGGGNPASAKADESVSETEIKPKPDPRGEGGQ